MSAPTLTDRDLARWVIADMPADEREQLRECLAAGASGDAAAGTPVLPGAVCGALSTLAEALDTTRVEAHVLMSAERVADVAEMVPVLLWCELMGGGVQ